MPHSNLEVTDLRAVGTIHGVAIVYAAGRNGKGRGTIKSLPPDGTSLAWKAPGSSDFGPSIDVSADGTYTLQDGGDIDKYIRVTTYSAHLLAGPNTKFVLIDDSWNNDVGGANFSAAEASAGANKVVQVSLTNNGASPIDNVLVWIDSAAPQISISDDGAAYVTPTTEAAALSFGSIAAGASKTLWIKTTYAAATGFDPRVLNKLHATFLGH